MNPSAVVPTTTTSTEANLNEKAQHQRLSVSDDDEDNSGEKEFGRLAQPSAFESDSLRKFRTYSGMQTFSEDIRLMLRALGDPVEEKRVFLSRRWLAMAAVKGTENMSAGFLAHFQTIGVVSALLLSTAISMLLSPPKALEPDSVQWWLYLITTAFAVAFFFANITLTLYVSAVFSLVLRQSDLLRALSRYGDRVDFAFNASFILGLLSYVFALMCAINATFNSQAAVVVSTVVVSTIVVVGFLPGILFWSAGNFVPYWLSRGNTCGDPLSAMRGPLRDMLRCAKIGDLLAAGDDEDKLERNAKS